MTQFDPSKMEVGKTYEIVLKDCCIHGRFQAKLVEATEDSILFDNGVELAVWNGAEFVEVTA